MDKLPSRKPSFLEKAKKSLGWGAVVAASLTAENGLSQTNIETSGLTNQNAIVQTGKPSKPEGIVKVEANKRGAEFEADSKAVESAVKLASDIKRNVKEKFGEASSAVASTSNNETMKINVDSLPPFLKGSLIEFNEIEKLFEKLKLEAEKRRSLASPSDILSKRINTDRPMMPEDAKRFCLDHLDPFVTKLESGILDGTKEIKGYTSGKERAIFYKKILSGVDGMYETFHTLSGTDVSARQNKLKEVTQLFKDEYNLTHSSGALGEMLEDSRKAMEVSDRLLGPLFEKYKKP